MITAEPNLLKDEDSTLSFQVGDLVLLERDYAGVEQGYYKVVRITDCTMGDYLRYNAFVLIAGEERLLPAELCRWVAKLGQCFPVHVNHADREAVALARVENTLLYEYEMPNGTSALKFLDELTGIERNVTYKRLPKQWRMAILDAVTEMQIVGNPQRDPKEYELDDNGEWR